MKDQLTQARLDELWDFENPSESERRFRDAVKAAAPASRLQAELITQLARAVGLQGRFSEADELLDGIDNGDGVVLARLLLERGRLRNSSGRAADAIGLFEEALTAAAAIGDDFLAVDAAHMLAIADTDRSDHWSARALETVDETSDPRVRRWAVSLHNNRGWGLFEAGKLSAALAEFELAADAARDYGTPEQQRWAQDAIDETVAEIGKQPSGI